VRETIHLRLASLSQQTNSILSVAAAIGNDFEFTRCRLVARVSADNARRRLDEASAAGVVTPLGPDRFRFSHALIREAVYDDIDANSRVRLHGKIGEMIQDLHRDDLQPHLAELAHHFGEARTS